MNSNAPNAMIARLQWPSGRPNAVVAKEETKGKLQMLLSPWKQGLDSFLFKEVRPVRALKRYNMTISFKWCQMEFLQMAVFRHGQLVRKLLGHERKAPLRKNHRGGAQEHGRFCIVTQGYTLSSYTGAC